MITTNDLVGGWTIAAPFDAILDIPGRVRREDDLVRVCFQLLGRTRLIGSAGEVSIPSRRVRGLLAALLFAGPTVVVSHRLADAVWEHPPRSAAVNLRTLVSQLRMHLSAAGPGLGDRLVTLRGTGGSGGYRLQVRPEECDAHAFQGLYTAGRAAMIDGDDQTAAETLGHALDMWNGPAGADLPATAPLSSRIESLNELRLHALENYHDVLLRMGEVGRVLVAVREVLEQNPLRERSWAHLIRAQYLSGDVGAALDSYRRLWRLLGDDLGIQPCPSVQDLYVEILRRDADAVRFHQWTHDVVQVVR